MTLIEFICIAICAVLQLIAMIVDAATVQGRGTAIAAAVLFAINMIIYAVDAFFLFALYRVNGGYLNNPATTQPPVIPQPKPAPSSTYDNSAFDYH